MTTKEIGDFGEDKAQEYLEKNGIRVLKRNYHARVGEIDIIAKEENTILFVEVKTRLTKDYGNPSEFVSFSKQTKIKKTAIFYLGRDDIDMRFDVVEVMYKMVNNLPVLTEINHIKDAF